MLSVLSLGRLLHSLSPSAKLALSASEFRIAVHPSFEGWARSDSRSF